MKRTTITLPEAVHAALEREAHRRRVSVSEIAREALEQCLELDPGEKRELPFIALGRSEHRNTARDMEAILASEWVRARDR